MLNSARIGILPKVLRQFSKVRRLKITASYSSESLQAPLPDDVEKIYPEKIEGIVNQITKLTILEVADLNSLLKKRLNIPDAPMMIYPEKIEGIVNQITKLTILEVADLNSLLKKRLNIPDAPMMAMGSMPANMAAQKQDDDEEEEATTSKVQTNFTLRIVKFDETKKVPLIKQVKSIMEGMNLVQAKKFIESLPAIVRTDASKEEAEKLQEELKAVGAECVIE